MRQKKEPFTFMDIPADIFDELRHSPPPTEAEVARFDYMRSDFMQMMRGPKSTPQRASLVDLVVSWSGSVLDTAREVRAEYCAAGLRPAWSCRAISANARETSDKITTTAEKQRDRYRLVLVYCSAPERFLELDVFDGLEKVQVRPFTVCVSDENGKSLAPPVTVDTAQSAPRFPDPAAGAYVFDVRWSGGQDSIRITINAV